MAAGSDDPTKHPNSSDPSPDPSSDPGSHPTMQDLDSAALRAARAALHAHPDHVGPYHIIDVINEGGMGIVYRAERRQPMHQIVALKMILLGMDTREVVARFETEREVLAMMDHPNIARVIDGGASETGRPFFVMEFVKGEPITGYCDRHQLNIRDRLELFAQVCDAVQHAHMKGIIHRDIKPSNVLVSVTDTGGALVKVIDFGVARATGGRAAEKRFFTEQGRMVGTPEYMSPEQAEMTALDVDTRTDIYSLGVLLYELLTGTLPFDPGSLLSRGYDEIRRIIREEEPPTPSTQITKLGDEGTSVAKSRGTAARSLASELRRELEWIPLMAMRKDRTRRYQSASDLGEDVRHYLQGEPLRAAPESKTYLAKKFVKKHRAGLATAAAIGVLLVGGIVSTTWQASRAATQRQLAQRRLQEKIQLVSAVAEMGRSTLFNAPGLQPIRDKMLHLVTDAQLGELETPQVSPTVRLDLATTYRYLAAALHESGKADDSLARAHESIELLTSWSDAKTSSLANIELAAAHETYGELLRESGDKSTARTELTAAANARRSFATTNPAANDRQYDLASSLINLANVESPANAIKLDTEALQMFQTLHDRAPENEQYEIDLANACRNLAVLARDGGDNSRAIALDQRALNVYLTQTARRPTDVDAQRALGATYAALGQLQQGAEQLESYSHALTCCRKLARDNQDAIGDQVNLVQSLGYLAQANFFAEKKNEASSLIDEAVLIGKTLSARMTDDAMRPQLAGALADLGWLQTIGGHPENALAALRAGLDAHPNDYRCTLNLAHALLLTGQFDQAKALYQQLVNDPKYKEESPAKDIADDFKSLRDAGRSTPEMTRIEQMIARPSTRPSR